MGVAASTPRPEAQVATGRLRGKTGTTPAGTRYHAFQGVPYAKPPVGELRFKAPQPAEPWSGVRDASVEGKACLSSPMPKMPLSTLASLKMVWRLMSTWRSVSRRIAVYRQQSEDCLFLNVYAPVAVFPDEATASSPKRPVLFMVHGGAFRMGDGNQDFMAPELFLDKNIVVVAINYRLGPFGFLSVGTEAAPGNAGLKDQALALRWVRDNIAAFGGDPDAVTIYGESAGGCSAHMLSLTPLCKGLFRGCIASSGTALTHWAVNRDGLRCARALARELGLAEADAEPEALAAALRTVSAASLNKAAYAMTPVTDGLADEFMFLPVVEPAHDGAFIDEHPLALVRDGKASDAPLMTGVCSAEGLIWVLLSPCDDATFREINEKTHFFVPPDLRAALTKEQCDECAREILQEYTGGKPITRENADRFVEMHGDIMWMERQVLLCRLHAAAGTSPVYLYRFNMIIEGGGLVQWPLYEAKLSKATPHVQGAGHADDLRYLMETSNPMMSPPSLRSEDVLCKRRMVQLWTNFIETGNPTPAGGDPELLPVEWQPCRPGSLPFLNIEESLELRTGPLFPRQPFWEALYLKYLGRRPLAADQTGPARLVKPVKPREAAEAAP